MSLKKGCNGITICKTSSMRSIKKGQEKVCQLIPRTFCISEYTPITFHPHIVHIKHKEPCYYQQ